MRTVFRMMVGVVAVLAVSVALPSAPSAGSPSAASGPGLRLTVTTPKKAYEPGQPVPLNFVVTNGESILCVLDAAAPGSVHVVSGTLDGKPVSPSFAQALPINGSTDVVTENMKPTAPGGMVSFTLDAQGPLGLTAMTPIADDSELVAKWPSSGRGTYRFQLLYSVPAVAGSSACSGASNVATVEYSIGPVKSGTPWWWAVAGAVALLLLAIVFWLLLRHRGRASVTAAVILAMFAGALAGGVARPMPAHADVTFFNGGGNDADAISKEYRQCIELIISFDSALWNTLNGPGSPVVLIGPWPENIWGPRESGPRDSVIGWAWNDTSHYRLEQRGVNLEPCTDLYHELKHAQDQANGLNSNSICTGSQKYNNGKGVPTDEVRATIAENVFRHAHGLLPRRFYDDFPLPSDTKACGPTKPTPNVGQRHCASSCAISNGDPHLTTFDAARYDFQAAGEFTAAASAVGDMTVQVRQQPLNDSRTVTVNTAIALAVGATHLGFYLDNGALVTHRDGAVTPFPVGNTALPGGAAVSRTLDPYEGDVYDVIWPDGSDLTLWSASVWGLVTQITAAKSRLGTLSGLLGNFDGNAADDLTSGGSGGAILAQPPAFVSLYPSYADSWRLTDATSLFDYGAGQSTKTFTDETFPSRPTQLTAAQATAAKSACDAVGVTDPTDLANCELDVAVTGQADFAVAASDTALTSSSTTAANSTTSSTSIASAGAVAKITFTAVAGERAYVQIVSTTLPGQCGLALALRGPDGNLVASGCLLPGGDIESTILTNGGTYTVVVDPDGNATGTVQIRVSLSRDQKVTSAIDGPSTTLTIQTPGSQARATFNGTAGQKIFVDASNATITDQCAALGLVSPNNSVTDLGCISNGAGYIDGVVLPVSGKYAVLIAPASGDIGQVTVKILGVSDQNLTAKVDGPTVTATVAQPGGVSRVKFNGTAGQKIQITYDSSSFPPQCGMFAFLSPEQSELDSGCTTGTAGTALTETLIETGQYTVLVDPSGKGLGSINLKISAVP